MPIIDNSHENIIIQKTSLPPTPQSSAKSKSPALTYLQNHIVKISNKKEHLSLMNKKE